MFDQDRPPEGAHFYLEDCKPHGELLKSNPRKVIERRYVCGPEPMHRVQDYEFAHCVFAGDLEGVTFSDCIFRSCFFDSADLHSVHFQNCKFLACNFRKGHWINVAFWQTSLRSCTLSDLQVELAMFSGASFETVAWNHGASIMLSCFDHCSLKQTSFNETVVNAVFRSCEICDGAFDHIVEGDSEVDICGSKQGIQIRAGKGQDPLEDVRVSGRPTIDQLRALDALLEREHLECHFQNFLEKNPQLLLTAVAHGHHGMYVMPQVRFGREFVADFMIGEKNSMGCFWTGLEIESPRHSIVKADAHFTAPTNHAINQIRDWRRYVRENTAIAQLPRHQGGVGLVDIDPKFKIWVISGRDSDGKTARARREQFLESDGKVHVQTWDGFRERVARAVVSHGK